MEQTDGTEEGEKGEKESAAAGCLQGYLLLFRGHGESIRDIVFRVIIGERGQRAIGGEVGERGFPGFPCGVEAQEGAAVFLVVLQQPDAGFRPHQLCAVSCVELNHGAGWLMGNTFAELKRAAW